MIPPGINPPPVAGATAPKSDADNTPLQAACRATWKAYGKAFVDRYQTKPVSNAKVRSNVKAFVQRIGFEESPQVAAWFVSHPNSFYVKRLHDFGCLLADAEKLRTEWATGRVMTNSEAAQGDRTAANRSAAEEAMRILEGEAA